jgi:pilus assembly protein CpaC
LELIDKIKLLVFLVSLSVLVPSSFIYVPQAYAQTDNLDSEPVVSNKVTRKKKVKRKPRVKYQDQNIVLGIRREIYFDFPLGNIKGPTDVSIFRYEINKKDQNPKLAKDRIVLTGLKAGITDLWIYDDQDVLRFVYNVTVTPQNLKRALGFLKQELKNVEGLKMYIREQMIILDGEILLPEDIARIHQVITGFEQGIFKIQFRLSPTLFSIVAEKMEKEIGLPDVQVEVVNQRFVIKGEVSSKDEFNYVTYKAALYLPKFFYTPYVGDPTNAGELVPPAEEFRDQPIINYFLLVRDADDPIDKVIKVAIYFVEIAKGFESNFGFTWAPSLDASNSNIKLGYSFPTQPADSEGNEIPAFTSTVTGIINNFIPKLRDAVKHERGRVIQSAAITVQDTKKGNIKKITSYPYLVTAPDTGPRTEFADVGISLDLTPSILGNNKQESEDINLGIGIEVSQVVSMSSSGVPVRSQNSVQTTVNMKSNETAAIGGIVNNVSSKSYGNQGGDDNIIINLSRSKSFQKNRSQFVVFVTPTILKTTSEGSNEVKEKFRIR